MTGMYLTTISTLTWPENGGNKTVPTGRLPERLYVHTFVPIVCGSGKWDSINCLWDWPLLLVFVRWPKCQVQLMAPGQKGKLRYDWTEVCEKLELQKIWNGKIDKLTVIYPKLQQKRQLDKNSAIWELLSGCFDQLVRCFLVKLRSTYGSL